MFNILLSHTYFLLIRDIGAERKHPCCKSTRYI